MMFRASSFVIVLLIAAARGAPAQLGDLRMVIGTDVVCRAEPDRTSPATAAPRLGDVFSVVDSRVGVRGQDTWYARAGRRPCWMLGSLTTPVAGYDNPDTALVALADHALNPATKATFEHLVAADNLLIERRLRRAFPRAPDTLPALLALRHLQIIQAAAHAAGDRWAMRVQPLRTAWVLGHADTVVGFESAASFHVSTARFWDLYERHQDAADAEQIAWVAATTPVYGDECYTDCLLRIVADGYMRYWRAFPKGSHVAEAVAVAIRRADYAARFCVMVATGNLTLDRDPVRVIADLRSSLDAVTTSGKGDLLSLLAEIEQQCRAGAVASLDDPRAIRGLVRALGAGFSLVPERLAAFGDRAAPAVLELLARPDVDNEVSHQALITLRHMVRDARLSPATLSGVRDAAERWLTTPRGNVLTLVSAIDLAGDLTDARLDRILDSLSTDRGVVAARGVTTDRGIEAVQRRAASAVAGRQITRP